MAFTTFPIQTLNASANEFPKVILVEGSAPSSPASGEQSLYIDSADHLPKLKDASGNISILQQRLRNTALTTPSNLADGDLWAEATGTSPSRVVTLKLRDGGSTITLLTITY
jgi:hypothetical protein